MAGLSECRKLGGQFVRKTKDEPNFWSGGSKRLHHEQASVASHVVVGVEEGIRIEGSFERALRRSQRRSGANANLHEALSGAVIELGAVFRPCGLGRPAARKLTRWTRLSQPDDE